MPTNRFFSHDDGTLFRYDNPGTWSLDGKVIRENFRKHHRTIRTGADLRATLREGPFAWPGGYNLYFVTSDGGVLSFDSARENLREILYSIRHGLSDGWRIVATGIDYCESDNPIYCDHSGLPICDCCDGETDD